MKDIKFTSCSPLQTCLRFSGTTTSRLHKACSFSNSSKTSGILKSLMLLLYSFTSQITNMAPVKKTRQCNSYNRTLFSIFTQKEIANK